MFRRLRAVFRRHLLDREMRDEMDAHLARATERLIARGMSPEVARLEARREFGNVGVLQEEARDVRGARWAESLVGDIRFALRHFGRRPLHAITIICVLSLGLGGHAATFAILQAATTRTAPGVPDDASLVQIRGKRRSESATRWMPRPMSSPEWRALAELRETFASVAAWREHDVVIRVDGEELSGGMVHFVSDNYLGALGIKLTIGAGLPPSEASNAPDVAAIISHAVWQRWYGGTTDVIGKTIEVNGVRAIIVGVAAEKFHGALPTPTSNMVWMSLPSVPMVMRTGAATLTSNDSTSLYVFGRLAAGVTPTQAAAAVRVVSSRAIAERARRATPTVYDTDVVPMIGTNQLPPNEDVLLMAAGLGSIALLVLLITCTNVSALVVGAAVARRHEIAVRLSLGASRARVVRQLITENTLLALAGGFLGLMLYWVIASLVNREAPEMNLTPDWWTFAFTAGIALGTGLLFGLSPALNATRRGVAEALKDSGAGHSARSRLQRAFVVAQIALTQPLLVGLAAMLGLIPLMQRAMANGVDQRLIYLRVDRHRVSMVEVQRLMDRMRGLPGVVQVIPDALHIRAGRVAVHPDDRGSSTDAAESFQGEINGAQPGYFDMFDIPIVRGRDLAATDTPSEAAVIGSDLARRLLGGADPIGKRLQVPAESGSARDLVIVGVYDAQFEMIRNAENRIYVVPGDRVPDRFLIRTAGPAAPLVDSVRAAVRSSMPTVPIGLVSTVESMREGSRREATIIMGGAAASGLLILLLASIGLYGVVALAVGQRRREIGIRMALGARATQVVGMLFVGGVRTSAIGLVVGLPLSIVALRVLAAAILFPGQVSTTLIGVAIAVVVLAVASLATWIPARRAATINPVVALRAE